MQFNIYVLSMLEFCKYLFLQLTVGGTHATDRVIRTF